MLAPWKKSYDQSGQHIKKQRHYFANKGPSIQWHGFSGRHEWMWELDHKEGWAWENWCFWTVVLEKTRGTLDCKEIQSIQPVNPKGNWSWIFTGRTEGSSSTLATWCEELISLKRPWYWERVKKAGEEYDRGRDGSMASPIQQTWVWASSGKWWGQGGLVCYSPWGSQRVGQGWATEQQQQRL